MKISGKENKLYYPNGDSITGIKEFLDFYNKCYYLKNNVEIEDRIKEILENGIQSPVELFRVLAWKLGKINMKKSTKDSFVYYEGMNEKSMQLRLYSNDDIMLKSDITELYKIIEKYSGNCNTNEKAQSFLNEIKTETAKKGWGKYFYSVYMITLLYFVSNGKYPIVDSFAYVALEAIDEQYVFGTRKGYPGLASRENTKFEEIVTKGTYKTYIDRFKSFLQLIKEPDLRKVDQALWTYGKLFKN